MGLLLPDWSLDAGERPAFEQTVTPLGHFSRTSLQALQWRVSTLLPSVAITAENAVENLKLRLNYCDNIVISCDEWSIRSGQVP